MGGARARQLAWRGLLPLTPEGLSHDDDEHPGARATKGALRGPLRDLKLAGMAAAVEEQLSSRASTALSFEERLALMVDREVHHRNDKRRAVLLKKASLKYPQACIEDVDSRAVRGFERSTLMSLALSRWVEDGTAILATGPTGSGKSWLACALAQYACRRGHSALYLRVPRLAEELRILALLQFFLNHPRFMRSRVGRQGKSPRELMTGQQHPRWFALLGLCRSAAARLTCRRRLNAPFRVESPDEHLACVRGLVPLGRITRKRSKMNHALQFFLNHRRFMRSRVGRQDKSPRELMTGQEHPHWFTLLGLGEPQPLRA